MPQPACCVCSSVSNSVCEPSKHYMAVSRVYNLDTKNMEGNTKQPSRRLRRGAHKQSHTQHCHGEILTLKDKLTDIRAHKFLLGGPAREELCPSQPILAQQEAEQVLPLSREESGELKSMRLLISLL